jgi:hypothetical protein
MYALRGSTLRKSAVGFSDLPSDLDSQAVLAKLAIFIRGKRRVAAADISLITSRVCIKVRLHDCTIRATLFYQSI